MSSCPEDDICASGVGSAADAERTEVDPEADRLRRHNVSANRRGRFALPDEVQLQSQDFSPFEGSMAQPQADPRPPYYLRWKRGSTTWTIRRLRPDRGYWGEYIVYEPVYLGPMYFSSGHAGTFEGSLDPSEYAQVMSLIDTIRVAAPATVQENTARSGLLGVLGEGSYGGSDILFRSFESSPRSAAEDAFAGIVAVFEKHMKPPPSHLRVVVRALRHNPAPWLKSMLRGGRCVKCGVYRGRLPRNAPCWGCGDIPKSRSI